MELYKRTENHKDPVKTAKRNFVALGILYVIIFILFVGSQPRFAGSLLFFAFLCLLISYFLGKRKMAGVYIGWFFVLSATGIAVSNGVLLSLIIVAYLGYWNYKAGEALKQHSPSNQSTAPNKS